MQPATSGRPQTRLDGIYRAALNVTVAVVSRCVGPLTARCFLPTIHLASLPTMGCLRSGSNRVMSFIHRCFWLFGGSQPLESNPLTPTRFPLQINALQKSLQIGLPIQCWTGNRERLRADDEVGLRHLRRSSRIDRFLHPTNLQFRRFGPKHRRLARRWKLW